MKKSTLLVFVLIYAIGFILGSPRRSIAIPILSARRYEDE